jgi:NADH:ubiquinone oxidoreductase subunit 3 (subunit A)
LSLAEDQSDLLALYIMLPVVATMAVAIFASVIVYRRKKTNTKEKQLNSDSSECGLHSAGSGDIWKQAEGYTFLLFHGSI